MKIGIDISQIVFQGTGVAQYTKKLVENLLRIDKENEYVFFGSSLRQKKRLDDYLANLAERKNVSVKTFPFPPLLLEFLWNKLHLLPIERLIGPVDVFHSSDWLQAPIRAKKVTTIHDLIVYKYPESFQQRGGHDVVANQKRRLGWVKKEGDLIIVDSEATREDVIEVLKIPQERIHVVYLAADERFRPQPRSEINKVKRRYKIKGDYLLSVGTQEPRKNLKRVIQAYLTLKPDYPKLSLLVAGSSGWGEEIKSVNGVKLLGFVPDEDLPALYSGAQCFVYPSLYEGFGLPVLEAMASGCPVVTSGVSSLPEVAGAAAVLVNPKSAEEIAEGIKKALKNCQRLSEKGLTQAKRFTWERTAKETLKVYREAASFAYQEAVRC